MTDLLLPRIAKRTWKCFSCGEVIEVGELVVHPPSPYGNRGTERWRAAHAHHFEEAKTTLPDKKKPHTRRMVVD